MINNFITVKKLDLPQEEEFVPQEVGRTQTKEGLLRQGITTLFLSCMLLSFPMLFNMIFVTIGDGGAQTGEGSALSMHMLQELSHMIKFITSAGFLMGVGLSGVTFLKLSRWAKHRHESVDFKDPYYFGLLYKNLDRYSEELLRAMACCQEYNKQTKEDILDYLVSKTGMDKDQFARPQTLFEAITTKDEEVGVDGALRDKVAIAVSQEQHNQTI